MVQRLLALDCIAVSVPVYQVDLEKPDESLHAAALEEWRFLEVHSVTLTSPLYPEPLFKPCTPLVSVPVYLFPLMSHARVRKAVVRLQSEESSAERCCNKPRSLGLKDAVG